MRKPDFAVVVHGAVIVRGAVGEEAVGDDLRRLKLDEPAWREVSGGGLCVQRGRDLRKSVLERSDRNLKPVVLWQRVAQIGEELRLYKVSMHGGEKRLSSSAYLCMSIAQLLEEAAVRHSAVQFVLVQFEVDLGSL